MGAPEPTTTLPMSAVAAPKAGLGPLRHVAVTGSTNEDLAAEARRGDTAPAVLVADHQTEGRGRLGRRWRDVSGEQDTGDGSLLVSLRLPGSIAEAHDRVACVSAAALEVAARAVRGVGARVHSKWPNDLLVESDQAEGKLAGVLAEIVIGDRPVVVVGTGAEHFGGTGHPWGGFSSRRGRIGHPRRDAGRPAGGTALLSQRPCEGSRCAAIGLGHHRPDGEGGAGRRDVDLRHGARHRRDRPAARRRRCRRAPHRRWRCRPSAPRLTLVFRHRRSPTHRQS